MEEQRHLYSAFGINISSEVRIPELKKREQGGVHAEVEYGEVEKPTLPSGKYSSKVRREGDGFLCYIRDIGGVRICDGRRIIVCPEDGAEEKGFRFLVSGIALGLLLHLRGFVTLHASAVAAQGRAIAFVGRTGAGKSTTAAALHARGYSIITDDLLVLDTTEGSVQAYPGYPHLKLTPKAIVESVNENPDRIPKIDPEGPKHSFTAEGSFPRTPLPLQCIYVLDYQEKRRRDKPAPPYSEAIEGKKAFIELVRNSYVARLLPEEVVSERHARRSAEVAQAVSMCRLYRKKSLGDLPALASFLEQEQNLDRKPGEHPSDNRKTHLVSPEKENE
jgi:hypothetical protein